MAARPARLLALLALVSCTRAAPEPTASPTDAGSTVTPADASFACVTNPKTYLDIINACTDAEAVDKTVDLSPMALPDGGLKPLP